MDLRPSSIAKRERILEAAEARFLEVGFDAVTMADIAERADVAKQTLYAHFGSKEALFVGLVTGITTGTSAQVQPVEVPDGAAAADVLEAYLARQLDAVLQPRVLAVRRLVIGEVVRFPALAEALWHHGPRLGIERIGALLAVLVERGALHVSDVPAAATQLNWLVMGEPVNAAMLRGDAALPSARERAAIVQGAVRVFLAAYGT
ncbi:TetR/AcrR family transcriptional regulator [Agrococcus jejuensis]|uniref:TetR/AcrR family transcriptional regulator n=1 Tax=Agrococcus jejuensis TaxID=399736 RepID=UPI00119D4D0E|nr:TetR/AcrR family transcriptional regulator [Agrococcus jejuensis]